MEIINLILHLDETMAAWSLWMGPWLYVVLFAIIFAETGLIVTPFLPGDSLLFAVGAITALPEAGLNVWILGPLLVVAAFLGDLVNYFTGHWIGPKIFSKTDSKFLNRQNLERTQKFYDKYGSRAIILGRFMPIVRTFVPFVAGVGRMDYSKFLTVNFAGGLLWITIFLGAGHVFGNLPAVKSNFHLVIFAVIFLSILPVFFEAYKARREK